LLTISHVGAHYFLLHKERNKIEKLTAEKESSREGKKFCHVENNRFPLTLTKRHIKKNKIKIKATMWNERMRNSSGPIAY
jgi:hypothetical protein